MRDFPVRRTNNRFFAFAEEGYEQYQAVIRYCVEPQENDIADKAMRDLELSTFHDED